MSLTACPRLQPVSYSLPHHLYQRIAGIDTHSVFNCGCPNEEQRDQDIDAMLRKAIQLLKTEFFDLEHGQVNYQLMRDNPVYVDYKQIAEKLNDYPLTTLTMHEEKLAFWLNLYNSLIINAVIEFDIEKSVQELKSFFAKSAYAVGGFRFSADDIEHGILRANAGHPAIPGKQFTANDPRTGFALEKFDPRIHFALNCASRSCPPINTYLAENIDQQLDLATRNFINGGEFNVDTKTMTVTLSSIFRWYAPDFGGNMLNQFGYGDFTNVLLWAGQFLNEGTARTSLLENPKVFKVKFMEYDWSLNMV